MDERKVTVYRCTRENCRAEDRDNGFNPPAPVVLNCWKCKAPASMYPTDQADR